MKKSPTLAGYNMLLTYIKEYKAESADLGIAKGRKEENRRIAKTMRDNGLRCKLISEITGLSEEEIMKL